MAKANSFKNEPWTSLEERNFDLFDSDFVHDKLLTKKINKKTDKSGISLSTSLTQKQGKSQLTDTLKFWFPFTTPHNHTWTVYGKFKSDKYKLHIDHGTINKENHSINFFSTVQGVKTLDANHYKFGWQIKHSWLTTAFRVRYASENPQWVVYNKSYMAKNNWKFWMINGFDFSNKIWNDCAVQVGWKDEAGNDWFLRGNGGKKYDQVHPKRILENATLNFIHKHSETTNFGVQAHGSLVTQELRNLSGVWEYRCKQKENTAIKVKGDIHRNFALSIKNNIKDYGNYVFGMHVSDFGKSNKFKYGIQVELNL